MYESQNYIWKPILKAQIWTHRVEIILYSDFLAFYVKTLIITIFGGRSVNIKLIWV